MWKSSFCGVTVHTQCHHRDTDSVNSDGTQGEISVPASGNHRHEVTGRTKLYPLQRLQGSYVRKSVTLLAAILATIGATGCQPRFVDLSYENRVQAYGVAHVAGKANGEAVLPTFTWLDANRMIFQRYIPDEPRGANDDNFLAAYDFEKQEWDFLESLARNHPCNKEKDDEVWFYNTNRLPNDALGFVIKCFPPFGAGRSTTHFLYTWDGKRNAIELYFDFDDGPHEGGYPLSAYTLSPDMREMVYSVGDLFRAYLYRVQADGQIRQLVPQFFRAWLPAWSPDGTTIAFMGNESYRGTPLDEVTSYSQMRPILFLPNDLYLLDAANDTVWKIAQDFTDFYYLRWLPGSNRHLSVAGTFGNTPGIWVIDIETRVVTRLWETIERYSWTPDGKLLVYEGDNRCCFAASVDARGYRLAALASSR